MPLEVIESSDLKLGASAAGSARAANRCELHAKLLEGDLPEGCVGGVHRHAWMFAYYRCSHCHVMEVCLQQVQHAIVLRVFES